MAYWMAPALPWEFGRPLDVVEFYSGKARIASLAHLMGYESRAVDLEYDVPPEGILLTLAYQKGQVSICVGKLEWRSSSEFIRNCFCFEDTVEM